MFLDNSTVISLADQQNLGIMSVSNDTWLSGYNPSSGAVCFGTEGQTIKTIVAPLLDPKDKTI